MKLHFVVTPKYTMSHKSPSQSLILFPTPYKTQDTRCKKSQSDTGNSQDCIITKKKLYHYWVESRDDHIDVLPCFMHLIYQGVHAAVVLQMQCLNKTKEYKINI